MPKVEGLHGLMIDNLRDMLSAEKQLVQALPRMAKAAETPELQEAIQNHLEQTKGHVNRLEQVFQELEMAPRAKHCKGMEGLLEEGKEVLEFDTEASVKDAGLIGAAQKVEHYEIAAYGTLVALANQMGHTSVAEILQQTLEEEKEADALLTEIAENTVNQQAETGMEDEEGEEAGGNGARAAQARRSGGASSDGDLTEDEDEPATPGQATGRNERATTGGRRGTTSRNRSKSSR
jgi:ferritin-like metal-binding protein YciE